MLVLSRRKNQQIFINGTSVIVTIVEIRGDVVRIGVEVDPSIPINRGEVQADIEAGIPQKPKVS